MLVCVFCGSSLRTPVSKLWDWTLSVSRSPFLAAFQDASPAATMMTANVDGGYLEALLRGYRAGILTSTDYANLTQCESIDGACWPKFLQICAA